MNDIRKFDKLQGGTYRKTNKQMTALAYIILPLEDKVSYSYG